MIPSNHNRENKDCLLNKHASGYGCTCPPETIDGWKQAMWDFILEHCEMLDSGTLFVKFHTSGRFDLEKRIRARWKYGYHREDVKAKETAHIAKQEAFQSEKKERHDKWLANREERRKRLQEVGRENSRRAFLRKYMPWVRYFGVKI